ncbi:MAG: hypothetical protein M1830_008757, partial [Pleopsidium flavum]
MGAIIRQSREFIDDLPLRAPNFRQNHTITPADDLKLFPFFVVANIFFGNLSCEQKDSLCELAPLREELFKEVIKGGINRTALSKYLPTPGNRLLSAFQKRWRNFTQNAYEEAKRKGADVPIVSLWEEESITKRE